MRLQDAPYRTADSGSESFRVRAPEISLPKGGGAIRAIGEKFAANPATGAGALTIAIETTAGRGGFGPKLTLSYDSGAGNGPFGFGWSLDAAEIRRKTEKGLPRYDDSTESDEFLLSGAEELDPVLTNAGGAWTHEAPTVRTVYGGQYRIRRYRPRVEGLFARIERWTNTADRTNDCWRSVSKDGITTWLRIRYANRTAYHPDLSAAAPAALPGDWCFELVFDYGDHDLTIPCPDEPGSIDQSYSTGISVSDLKVPVSL